MAEIVNPYIAGAPVTEQRMFFGREDIFQWIENSIAGQFTDHILVVHGQRRVGKTSVLKQLGNRLPKRFIPVFFDLQGRTHTTLDHFLWWLARETVRVLKQERGIEVRAPEKDEFARDPEYFENVFLAGLGPTLGDNSLLYTFDEFDNLEESDVKEELARPLTDYLRRLMGRGEMNFIFSIGSSGRKLENMQAAYTEFFKTALYKKISFLSKEQTHGLVTRPVEGVLEYERAAVERIYRITSGHPYFTQLTCHELFARCQSTQQRKIAVADVESVLDDVVERGTVNLKFVWDEASDIEKWSLAALAHLDKADNRALADYLRKNRVRFSESDLTSGLLHLREKDVLTSQNQFVIHLLKLWLQKNRPIEQVREELTEANPIASRFIEIGLEFREGGQHDKAIEYFRQALSISADNLQAQVNIALTYASQGQLEQAIVEFEKALKIDDEDVTSRAGLCDAYLVLGDAALQKGRAKEAVLSYQRVLAINAEHLEARQRMAEICRQRGEKALTDGKDEEALNAFTEALKYTPEDAALLARVEKVRAEKKAKVLAAQVARSEKEAAARNWDKAIAALNEALETAPGDESILKKIEATKKKKLQEQLNAILAKVEAAEKTGRWDTAIAGLNEYLRLSPEDAAIQKRLADLIEARHAAWLNGVMTRVDQAVTAQNWDEALTALNEALRLEPDNAEMQTRAAQVREMRRVAGLNSRIQRADQAVEAGCWDEAIDIINDGLASDPENEALKTKLAEARKAKREARLQAALQLAESAAQSGKWETAIASLNEVLANEPDNIEFQQKLVEIRARERQSQWEAALTQAEGLREAERFEQALQVWQDYLSLYPDEREQVDGKTKPIMQERELFDLYGNAEGAIYERDFDKAIPLLKEIIIRDENYKDASRLLTKAIESRRAGTTQRLGKVRTKPASPKPVQASITGGKRMWVIGGLATIMILGIGGGLFWLSNNGLFAAPAPTSTATRVAPTITPTPTLDLAIYIPAGEFQMGSENGDSDERPVHTVYLDAYWIDATEVTNTKYKVCVQDGACEPPGGDNFSNSQYDNHPVVSVSWYDAQAYCEWAGGRLPTEAEWEKAARGTDGRAYPWGESFDCGWANADDETSQDDYVVPGVPHCDGYDRTSPVGGYENGVSPYGLYDMAGNVWEWVADWYDNNYYDNSPDSNPSGPSSGNYKVMRGGAWNITDDGLRSAVRGWNFPSFTLNNLGFRCARKPPSASTESWVTDFAEPILSAISKQSPTIDDNLDSNLGDWTQDSYCKGFPKVKFENGEAIVSCSDATRSNMAYKDFVLELDIRFMDSDKENPRFDIFYRNNTLFTINPDGTLEAFYGGNTISEKAYGDQRPNRILIIVKGNRCALYVNDQPVNYYEDNPNKYYSRERIIFWPNGPVALDNLKIWDLEKIPNLP